MDTMDQLTALMWRGTFFSVLAPLLLSVGAVLMIRARIFALSILQLLGAVSLLASVAIIRGILHHSLGAGEPLTSTEMGELAQLGSQIGFFATLLFAGGYLPSFVRAWRAHGFRLSMGVQLTGAFSILCLRVHMIWLSQSGTIRELAEWAALLAEYHVTDLLFLVFTGGYVAMSLSSPGAKSSAD